jgi:hypothetical protein
MPAYHLLQPLAKGLGVMYAPGDLMINQDHGDFAQDVFQLPKQFALGHFRRAIEIPQINAAQFLIVNTRLDVGWRGPAFVLPNQADAVDMRYLQQPPQFAPERIISQHPDRVNLLNPQSR